MVFSGKVTSLEEYSLDGHSIRYAEIHDAIIYKGAIERRLSLNFIFSLPIPDLNPSCCKLGEKYLFFAEPFGDTGYWISANGPFGVYRIEGGQVLRWHKKDDVTMDAPLESVECAIKDLLFSGEQGQSAPCR